MHPLAFKNWFPAILTLFSFFISGVSAYPQGSGKIVEYNTSVKIENSNLVVERAFCLWVDDKQSDWLSDIKIPYNKSDKIDILDAYVMTSGGAIVRKLQKKEIKTLSDISENAFYEDDMAKEFSLRSNEYPYYIFYSFRITTSKYIALANWWPLWWPQAGVGKSTLRVEVPQKLKVTIFSTGELRFSKDSTEDSYIYNWEVNNTKPIINQVMSPPERELLPRVMVIPESFTYGVPGKLDSWKSLGLWQEEINRGMDLLPLSEQIKVTSLLTDVSDRHEKMRKLYHYMQDNTHYVFVRIDIGGLQPYPATFVCTNKYGDCKALTMYMKALLKFAGIESFYTITYAGINPVRTLRELPSFQFNHVILCVPDGKDTVWLENTSQTAPFGYLGCFTQDRYALVVNGEKSELVRTPAMDPDDFQVNSSYQVTLGAWGKSSLTMEKTVSGSEFVRWLNMNAEGSEEEKKEAVGKELKVNNEVLKYEILHHDRDQQYIKIRAYLSADGLLKEAGGTEYLAPFPLDIYPFEKPEERKYPVRISYPVNKKDSIEYDLTMLGEKEIEIPAKVMIRTRFGTYQADFIRGNRKVTEIRTFIMPVGDYSLDDYKSLYAFIESVKKSVRTSVIILTPKS